MNQDINPLDLIARDLSQSVSPLILLSESPSMDAVYASLTLYLGLSKLGKAPIIASSTKVTYPIRDIDLIRTNTGTAGDNLVISFPYTDGSIDKVDYRIQNNTFNLIVIPRPGFPRVTQEQIAFSYTGGKADCIITLDAPSIESLGRIYAEQQATYDQLPLINIDRHENNMQFGSVNYVIPAVASTSQLVFDVMRGVQIAVDNIMATHILAGIVAATANFTAPTTSAEVFADVTELMKLGAVRQDQSQTTSPTAQSATQAPQRVARGQQGTPAQTQPNPPVQPPANPPRSRMSSPSVQQAQRAPQTGNPPSSPGRQGSWADTLPQNNAGTPHSPSQEPAPDQSQSAVDQGQANDAPQDWLKPKIFKGTGFV